MKRLTLKQKGFVRRFIENNGNGTQAALDVYNTNDPSVAKVIASQNLTKPNVRRVIELSLERAGLTDDYVSELLREATVVGLGQKATNADSLRGIEMMLKLKDAFPAQKSAHVRFDHITEYKARLEKMSTKDLGLELEKQKNKTRQLLKDMNS